MRGKHVTDWYVRENRIVGKYNGESIVTSPIVKWEKYADMRMVTTQSGSVYFIYDDRK